MALELRQQLKLAQKLVMTPQLRQAIKLLQLNRLELTGALQAEMEQNPLLEEVTDEPEQIKNAESLAAEEGRKKTDADNTSQVKGENSDNLADINWSDYTNTFDTDLSFAKEKPPADAPSQFDFIFDKPGLKSYLHWQLSHLSIEPKELDAVFFIIGNLDNHGFFKADIEDISKETGYSHEEAEELLSFVQSLDPPGIAARDIRESLLLQLDRLDLEDSLPARIIKDHMNLLESRNYGALAKKFGVTTNKIIKAIDVITHLTPYPGNEFSNEQINYIVPDVYVYKIEDEFVIQLNNEGLPNLRLSDDYKKMLERKKLLDAESKGYLKEKMRSAEWFIKSIQQRQRTIYKVMESLLKFQRDFFDHGPEQMKPLILRDVAEDIEMHESTVSRVTSNKYVHTPQGIFELKYFFSTAVSNSQGDAVSAESIKTRIKQLIRDEDPYKPLSDNVISKLLAEKNIKVARRTIAKYRDQMKILPVKHRRKPRM